MKMYNPFLDMEWWCDHAIAQRVCDGCGQTISILSNVAGKNDDIEETHAITCENCGYVNYITVHGVLLKVVQNNE